MMFRESKPPSFPRIESHLDKAATMLTDQYRLRPVYRVCLVQYEVQYQVPKYRYPGMAEEVSMMLEMPSDEYDRFSAELSEHGIKWVIDKADTYGEKVTLWLYFSYSAERPF